MQKERITHMLEKIKEKIDKCEPMSSVFIIQTSEFIQDSYNNREIDTETFNELRHILKTAASSFPLNCSCIVKNKKQ